jgi:hypothetical protein
LITSTAAAMDMGVRVIGDMQMLGRMADNAERPSEVLDACKGIEGVMLRLVDQVCATNHK